MIDQLLAVGAPYVGSLVAARGNAYEIIGHYYEDYESLKRLPLYYPDLENGQEVGAVSGASLLLHKSIFNEVDYSGYTDVDVIPGRHTADDEYIALEIYNKLKIKPKICIGARSWHYNDDGYKYKILGLTQKYD